MAKEPLTVPSFWKAKYDFQGNEDENQLSFKAGDTFVMMQLHEGGWFTAQRNGETGYVPSNYFEEITAQNSAKSLPTPPQRKPRSHTQLNSPTQDRIHHLSERSQSALTTQPARPRPTQTQDDSARPLSPLALETKPAAPATPQPAVQPNSSTPRAVTQEKPVLMTEPGAARNLAPPPQFARGAPLPPRGRGPPPMRGAANLPTRSATTSALNFKPRGLTDTANNTLQRPVIPVRTDPNTSASAANPSSPIAKVAPPPAPKRSYTANNQSSAFAALNAALSVGLASQAGPSANPAGGSTSSAPSELQHSDPASPAAELQDSSDDLTVDPDDPLRDSAEDMELRDSGVVYVTSPGPSTVDESASQDQEDSHEDEPLQRPPLPSAPATMFKPPEPSTYPPIPSRSDKEAHDKIAAALTQQLSSLGGLAAKQASVASNRIGEPVVSPQAASGDQLSSAQTHALVAGYLFTSYNKKGKAWNRWVYISPELDRICWKEGPDKADKRKAEIIIFINDVIALKKGYAVLEKKKTKPPGNQDKALSIIVKQLDETILLDLEAETTEVRDQWFDNIERLLRMRANKLMAGKS